MVTLAKTWLRRCWRPPFRCHQESQTLRVEVWPPPRTGETAPPAYGVHAMELVTAWQRYNELFLRRHEQDSLCWLVEQALRAVAWQAQQPGAARLELPGE